MEYSIKVKVVNKLGFHLRAVAVFVKEAEKFMSDIKVRHKDVTADGKSIMGLMTLVAAQGTEIEISASGNDAKEAVMSLKKVVENKFGEKE
ncbi:MAG: HPr family phosphocarrier protein [Candidatus Goldiibacteriota bacterium]